MNEKSKRLTRDHYQTRCIRDLCRAEETGVTEERVPRHQRSMVTMISRHSILTKQLFNCRFRFIKMSKVKKEIITTNSMSTLRILLRLQTGSGSEPVCSRKRGADLLMLSGTKAICQTFTSSNLPASRSNLLGKCLKTTSTSNLKGNQTSLEGTIRSRTSFRSLLITKNLRTRSTPSRNIRGRRQGAQEARWGAALGQEDVSILDSRSLIIRWRQTPSFRSRGTSKLNFLRLANTTRGKVKLITSRISIQPRFSFQLKALRRYRPSISVINKQCLGNLTKTFTSSLVLSTTKVDLATPRLQPAREGSTSNRSPTRFMKRTRLRTILSRRGATRVATLGVRVETQGVAWAEALRTAQQCARTTSATTGATSGANNLIWSK